MKRFLVVEIRDNEICVHGCVWAKNANCAGFNFYEASGYKAQIRVVELKEEGRTFWDKPFGGGELCIEQAQVPVTLGPRAGQSRSILCVEHRPVRRRKETRP